MKRIIGIDPGILHTGWAIIESIGASQKYIASGVILPPKSEELAVRLAFIFCEIKKLCDTWQPDECAIEIIFVNLNPKTTLVLAHARAAAMIGIANNNIPVFEYEANKIKKAICGAGHADKNQIHKMLKLLLPSANPKTEDEADAIAIAICHSNTSRYIC